MTQFNQGKEYEGIRTIKIFEFENTRSYVKKCCDHWEKMKAICKTNHIHQPGVFTYKSLQDFTDEPVIQCDVPVIENTFVCRWL